MAAVRPSCTLLALLALGSTPLAADDFVAWTETGDWYLSLGVTQAPEIEEKATGVRGSSTYEWKGIKDSTAPRIAIGYLACAGGARGGWTLGIEGVLTTCDVTPSRYEVGSLLFNNTSNDSLRYSTLGMTVFGGYQFGINPDADTISTFLIIGPFLGFGGAMADSEVRDQSGIYASDNGFGWYLEGGLRGGFFLTEKNWVFGVTVDFMIGSGEVDVSFDNNTESTLTHDRVGLAGAVVLGYRL